MRCLKAAILLLAAIGGPSLAATPPTGRAAPDFHATLFDGTKVTLADFRGQVLVINFWATWCVPCKAELPRLDAFYRARRVAGLQVIAVTTEDSVPVDRLKPLAAALAIPIVRRFHGPYAPIGNAVPTNYIIDRNGVVRYAKANALSLDAMNELLIPLLNEPIAPASVPPVAGH